MWGGGVARCIATHPASFLLRAEPSGCLSHTRDACGGAADNVIYDGEFRTAKIADFGESRTVKSSGSGGGAAAPYKQIGTLLFSAPEQVRHGRCDRAVDVWAFGCVLVCLFTDRSSPYPSTIGLEELRQGLLGGTWQPELPHSSSPSSSPGIKHPMQGFVRDTCRHDPESRPLAQDLAKQLAAAHARCASRPAVQL